MIDRKEKRECTIRGDELTLLLADGRERPSGWKKASEGRNRLRLVERKNPVPALKL